VYLETETERNVAFYERFGFRVVDRVQPPIVTLTLWGRSCEPAMLGR